MSSKDVVVTISRDLYLSHCPRLFSWVSPDFPWGGPRGAVLRARLASPHGLQKGFPSGSKCGQWLEPRGSSPFLCPPSVDSDHQCIEGSMVPLYGDKMPGVALQLLVMWFASSP